MTDAGDSTRDANDSVAATPWVIQPGLERALPLSAAINDAVFALGEYGQHIACPADERHHAAWAAFKPTLDVVTTTLEKVKTGANQHPGAFTHTEVSKLADDTIRAVRDLSRAALEGTGWAEFARSGLLERCIRISRDAQEFEKRLLIVEGADASAVSGAPVVTGLQDNPRPPALPGDTVNKTARRLPTLRPHDIKAYQLLMTGKTQKEIAQALNEEYGTDYGQGQVSRMIGRAKRHAEASGLAGLIPPPAAPAKPIDPKLLDLGARTDHRTRSQRKKRSDDEE